MGLWKVCKANVIIPYGAETRENLGEWSHDQVVTMPAKIFQIIFGKYFKLIIPKLFALNHVMD